MEHLTEMLEDSDGCLRHYDRVREGIHMLQEGADIEGAEIEALPLMSNKGNLTLATPMAVQIWENILVQVIVCRQAEQGVTHTSEISRT